MELSFYPGCTAHSTAWEFTKSTMAVMNALGITLKEIDDWNCCGGASARAMNRKVGLGLPARNLLIAEKAGKPLLIPCAGCYNNTRRAQSAFEAGGAEAENLSATVEGSWGGGIEVWSFVDYFDKPGVADLIRSKVKKPLTGLKIVAYYGCQLLRPPAVTKTGNWENPTALEKACEAAGATAIDWSYKVDCCGADMGISHGHHAEEMCTKLGEMAEEAGADAIVVSCGLCQANLDMRQAKTKIPVIYVTELLGEAFQSEGRETWWKKHLIDPSGLFTRRA